MLRLLLGRYRIIHHHAPDPIMRIILGLAGIFHKSIYIHIHGASLEDDLQKPLVGFLLARFLRFTQILADNSAIAALAETLNPRSLRQIDAFFPPPFDSDIHASFAKVLPAGEPEQKTIAMVGWFSLYQGQDLYGFDIALQALHQLRSNSGLNVRIVAAVNGIRDADIYQNFLDKRRQLNLESSFLLLEQNLQEIWPLYLASHVFIRPTCTDGSSLAIREALWFETRVIASDAVPRPAEVRLFTNRDANSLSKLIESALNETQKNVAERIATVRAKKFVSKLFTEVYKL
jgi:hypothetical protein